LLSHALELFGFNKITGIEMENELPGEMRPWREWSRSLLATTSFGQGISTTPIQVVAAWSALANGGKLMKPTIIDRVIHSDGTEDVTQPTVVDQAISKQASETMTAMLVSSVEKGFAKAGRVPGYRIAGKTGTSQIAGPGGKYDTGSGSTVATFAGYAPVTTKPRFVILVKLDRPKNTVFGVEAAAPVFRDIAKFLFQYYGIPPDAGV
jgi:cell division protein FtsI/penicillin-binding protein 2